MQTSNRLLPATAGSEYHRILGPDGAVGQAVQSFLAQGFSPRKPLRLGITSFYTLPMLAPIPRSTTIVFGQPRMPLRLAA